MISNLVSQLRQFNIRRQLLSALIIGGLCAAAAMAASVTYEYDEVGRLRKATYDDGSVVTYVLDAAGNRTSVDSVVSTAAGSLQFTAATYSVGEGGGSVTITVSRAGGSVGAVGLTYNTSNGTATAGSDYTARVNLTLSWANGDAANKTFTVPILEDSLVEGNETVNLLLSAPTGGATLGAQSTAVLTVTDNDVATPGSIQFSAATYSVGEGGASATITATRTGGSSGVVGVTYNTSNGTATAASDYTPRTNLQLSWANGDTANKTFTVPILEDSAIEGSETVNLALSAPTGGATLGAQSTAVLTITDNDVAMPGSIQFSAATYSVGEGGASVTITATRTGGSTGVVGVTYNTSNGTATAGSDYTARVNLTLSWANGDSANKTFTVPILEDSAVEGGETVNLALSAPTGGATLGSQSTAVLTITDNDVAPAGTIQFTASGTSVAENGTSVTITASRVGGSNGIIGATYNTANGTATSGSDFTAITSQTLSWANGDTANKTFTVNIADDTLYEGNETFTAALSSPTGGATLGTPASITVTITDNDSGPVFSIANMSAAESAGTVTLTVTKTGSTSLTHAVTYATAAGTATAGSDYTTTSSSLSFAPGETSKTFTVPILENSVYENSESFTVALSNATNGATVSGSAGTATVTITDNDSAPVFSIAGATPAEASGGIALTITKTGSSGLTHAVNYATANGTATAGADYTATSSSISFSPGESSKTINVPILEDSSFEGNETFTVVLSGATNGATVSGGAGTATVTIIDNDSAPVFSIASVAPAESAGAVTLTVTKAGGTSLTHAVNYATANGTAIAGSDYTTTSSTLTFLPGDTSKTFTVAITEDSLYEQNETFTVALSGATNGATVSAGSGTATVTINDNDPAATFSINSGSVNEGGTSTLTVTKSNTTALTHNVSYASQAASAIAGSDYSSISSTLTFAPGETAKTITVNAASDSIFEGSEFYSVVLTGATNGASISGGSGTVTINDANSPPSFSVNSITQMENAGPFNFTITKSGNSALSHTVSYATGNGTAIAGQDYVSVSGSHTFAPGETSWSFPVSLTAGNGLWEGGQKTFSINLSGATGGASIATPSVTSTIIEIVTPPVFTINSGSIIETAGSISLTVTKSGSFTALSHTVPFSTSNGTATAGSDYTATSSSVTFGPSETTKSISIPILNDAVTEGSETFTVSLGTPSGGAVLGSPSSGTVTITEGGSVPSKANWVTFAGCNAAQIANGSCSAYFQDTQTLFFDMDYTATGAVTQYIVEVWGSWSTGWELHQSNASTHASMGIPPNSWVTVRVRACNTWGCGPNSDEMTAQVSDP